MSVLYPPTILEDVPPMIITYSTFGEGEETQKIPTRLVIKIPFSYGRATSPSEVSGMKLIIKGVPSNDLMTTNPYEITKENMVDGIATFDITANGALPKYLEVGSVYKILIAFYTERIDPITSEILKVDGYYSTPAIVKATTMPVVEIEEANNKNDQNDSLSINADYGYITKVTFGDQTDSLYSTQLIITEELKQEDGEILEIVEYRSDIILHNSSDEYIDFKNQEKYQTEPCNIYVPYQVEDEDYYFYSYKIKSEIKTVNGLIVQSEEYLINNLKGPSEELKDSVWLTDEESGDGYNQVSFGWDPDENIINNYQFFYFVLQKKRDNKKYVNITEGDLSKLKSEHGWYKLYHKDFIIDFATSQYYRVIVYFKDLNNNSNSLYVVSPDILELSNYFEHTYIFDGQRQLTLAYNTEISGFKNNILENKIETIGSQYPVFFRNGVVNYKEIQVTSLISMLSDGNNMFSDNGCGQFFIDEKRRYTSEKISTREEYDFIPTTDLVDINIKQERLFREEVYNWLTNGKVKLFKSPTEGTFFIRIMNVSLSPNQQLARMLYSVSFTAYEVSGLENNDIEYLLKENGYE